MADIKDVVAYFLHLDQLNEGEGLSNLKMQKLAYYAQGFYSAINDEPLFDNAIQAWAHGPVVVDLYHQLKQHGSNAIPCPEGFDPETLSEEQRELLDEVFDVFGQFSAWKLRNMTHEEKPWLDHEDAADQIPLSEITSYFKTRLH